MGNCSDKRTQMELVLVAITRAQFQCQYVIGRGGFGQVWRVEKKKERKEFAMKEMSKARIISKQSISLIMNERKILNNLRHP